MNNSLIEWYSQLSVIKEFLITKDKKLESLFDIVDKEGFQLHSVVKDPYTALIGAIIGQKITYKNAKNLRSQLYSRFGSILLPMQIKDADLDFLGLMKANIVKDVTNYILINNIDLNTEKGLYSLMNVKGIGLWTIETTLLTCLMNWNLFPMGDKFLQTRMKRLYGNNCNINVIIENWSPYKSIVTWYLWRWF